jgi:hypothetical protein
LLELVPLCRADLEIAPAVHIGKGPRGDRWIAQVLSITLTGDRLSGHSVGSVNADWVTVIGGIATIDVRATIQTEDGAYIYVQYTGRTDATRGVGAEPAYTTPVFETGDERYRWLNGVQAVGASHPSDLSSARYDWYELRSS